MRIFLVCLLICLAILGRGQATWNNNSFKFSRDTISLLNMTGATNVSFSGAAPQPVTSGLINFPAGFSFRFGLKTYTTFAVSTHGFIRLGIDIINNKPELQDDVIVPLCNGTFWSASYLLTGTAPNRQFIIQWTGSMQPTGEPTKFQLRLSERIGKIEFIYQQIGGYYGWTPAVWSYKVFCKTFMMSESVVASLLVPPNNAMPPVNYSTVILNNDSIYAKTRYTFQPDTVKPANPSGLSFSNIMAGCLNVNWNDNSNNESVFMVERSDDNVNFFIEKRLFVSSPAGTGVVTYNQTLLQPYWNYKYKVYASNGFINSDTISGTVQTLMPQMNGIKTVPGDYPTITALLQDAACKHLGPDLIIELQNNYSFANETLPLTFPKTVTNRLIHSIVIRPALNANITWTAANTILFVVDSVKHVILDGRPGGVGTSRNLNIVQQTALSKVIHYFNAADSGMINYCNIVLKRSDPSLSPTGIMIDYKNPAASRSYRPVNGFTLSNSSISADSASANTMILINSPDSTGTKNTRIINNEFSRFRGAAISVQNGAENSIISGNHFFQTDVLPGPLCVLLANTEMVTVEDNYIGGSSPVWGQGKWVVSGTGQITFIRYQHTSHTKPALIRNNKFGNIHGGGSFLLISADYGAVTIDNNKIGTTDSLNSITQSGSLWLINLWMGRKYVTNNFVSGVQAQVNSTSMEPNYVIISTFVDSLYIHNNDLGGSNNLSAITSYGTISGVFSSVSDNASEISSNEIRGLQSRAGTAYGISNGSGSTSSEKRMIIDSNRIHHLRGFASAVGISSRFNSTGISRISNNNIYALSCLGQGSGLYGPVGFLQGIGITIYNFNTSNMIPIEGTVRMFGNRIHSLEPIRVLPASEFSISGISASAAYSNVFNNDIRLGLNASGQPIDSINTMIEGMYVRGRSEPGRATTTEHNSIYIGGRGLTGYGISTEYYGTNDVFVTNNIIQVDRNLSSSTGWYPFQGTGPNAKIISAKNNWYSSTIPNVQALMTTFRTNCGTCDSSSFIADPKFVNAIGDSTHYDFRLAAGSSAEASGTPSIFNIPTDIEALVRNNYSPVDIGSHAGIPCAAGNLPVINITSPTGDQIGVCASSTITLTASITGGSFQQLQWQRNLNNITGGTGTSLVISTPGAYRLIGINACGQAASRTITVVATTGGVQPSVSITSSAPSICLGSSVTFTATPINGGTAPVYQWQVNGVNAGNNSPTFITSTLSNNDQVKVILTNTTTCAVNPSGTSNTITMAVNQVVPTINISGPTTVTAGEFVTLISTITNGGTTPAQQWQDSTNLHNWQDISGQILASISYAPALTGNKIRCRLTSNANCVNPTIVYSSGHGFTVNTVTAVNPVPATSYGIRYYPNPVTSLLYLDSLNINDNWESLSIVGIDGTKRWTATNIAGQSTIQIKVDHLSSGVYMLILYRKKGLPAYLKFIKM